MGGGRRRDTDPFPVGAGNVDFDGTVRGQDVDAFERILRVHEYRRVFFEPLVDAGEFDFDEASEVFCGCLGRGGKGGGEGDGLVDGFLGSLAVVDGEDPLLG